MIERAKYDIVESPLGRNIDPIEAKINEKISMPFSNSEIIIATIDSGKKIVVKIPPNNMKVVREWRGLKTAWTADISVPTPIALVKYTKNRFAIVSEFVEGDILFFNPNPDIETGVGKQMRSLHQHAIIDGDIWKSSERDSFTYYDRFISRWRSKGLNETQEETKTTSLLDKFTDVTADFCMNSMPVFNHNDLHDGQIIVDENKMPTIIDFGNWTEETWLNELGYNLFHCIRTDRMQADNFTKLLQGYLGSRVLSESEKTTLAFYLLFISARALNYFKTRHSSYLPTAEETHTKVLNYIESEDIWKKY